MMRLAGCVSLVTLAALAGCGPAAGKRSALAEREIEQCIAGMGGVIPDEAQRKIVCECTADAKFNPRLSGDALAEATDQCREKAGMDPKDPFGILGNDSNAAPDGNATTYSGIQ